MRGLQLLSDVYVQQHFMALLPARSSLGTFSIMQTLLIRSMVYVTHYFANPARCSIKVKMTLVSFSPNPAASAAC